MSADPPEGGQANGEDRSAGDAQPAEIEGPSGVWFLVAMAVVLVPFAAILMWAVLDAPKYLFQR